MSFTRWRSAVAAGFTLLLMGVLAPTADADEEGTNCRWFTLSDGTEVRICEPILVRHALRLDDCPPRCGFSLRWLLDIQIHPEARNTIHERISNGLRLLGMAAHTSSPADRARYESEAASSFATAVRANGRYRFEVQSVGVVPASTGGYRVRRDLPWLTAAAADVAEGVRLAQQPGPGGGPGAAAMRKFKQAYTELSEQRIGAG